MRKVIGISPDINSLMAEYKPKGQLEHTTRSILKFLDVNHVPVKVHAENVARLAVIVGKEMKKDIKAILYSALLHDIGKLFLPANLFDGRSISSKEYAEVKKHALMALWTLGDKHIS